MNNSYDLSAIQYIFAKPHVEHYYLYGVNTTKQLNLIPKEQLRNILEKDLKCTDFETIEFIFSRNMPFLYDSTTKKIKQFQYTNDIPTKKDIKQKFINEMNDQLLQVGSSFKNQCDNIWEKNNLFTKARNIFGRQYKTDLHY